MFCFYLGSFLERGFRGVDGSFRFSASFSVGWFIVFVVTVGL